MKLIRQLLIRLYFKMPYIEEFIIYLNIMKEFSYAIFELIYLEDMIKNKEKYKIEDVENVINYFEMSVIKYKFNKKYKPSIRAILSIYNESYKIRTNADNLVIETLKKFINESEDSKTIMKKFIDKVINNY